jgi:hypothetical protein
MNELKKDINQTIRFNRNEHYKFLKESVITLIPFAIHYRRVNDIREIIKYYVDNLKQYYIYIKNERELLKYIRQNINNISNLDFIEDILNELDEYMKIRFLEYDHIFLQYEDLTINDDLNNYNYKITKIGKNIDEIVKNEYIKVIHLNRQ